MKLFKLEVLVDVKIFGERLLGIGYMYGVKLWFYILLLLRGKCVFVIEICKLLFELSGLIFYSWIIWYYVFFVMM